MGARVLVLLVSLICLSTAVSAQSDSADWCLYKAAARIQPEKRIILLDTCGTSIIGRLITIDLQRNQVTLSRVVEGKLETARFGSNEIVSLTYTEHRIKPLFILLGPVGGLALTGLFMRTAGIDCGGGWEGLDCAVTVGVTSVSAGLLLGTIVPWAIPSHKRIDCSGERP